jgi:hypothetical protein
LKGDAVSSSYQCPYCNEYQAITYVKQYYTIDKFDIDDTAEGTLAAAIRALSCANPKCKRTTVDLTLGSYGVSNNRAAIDRSKPVLFQQRLLPHGHAKTFPDYIPSALLEDYREACLIRDLSPKAAATLVRRCLQGMIRNFTGITKNRLVDEIAELKRLVDEGLAPKGVTHETVDAIDHVRGIGNIGAHMEKDINLIIPVEPEEAAALIELVEMLFEDWYVARHVREEKLARIKGTAELKHALKAKRALPEAE